METGLYYNRFRYYNPEDGQYVSQDPIGLMGGMGLYKYVPEPNAYVDNLGLAKCDGKISRERKRQQNMLDNNTGYNISPFAWDKYPTIGRNGSFISDKVGTLKYFGKKRGNVVISKTKANKIEKDMGLVPRSLEDGFKVRKVSDVSSQNPRNPLEGNVYFKGPGNHLPGGAPEMVIDSISTLDNSTVTTILNVFVK